MKIEISVWPFLISRNLVLDYRPIVVPDFLIKTGKTWLLADIAGGDVTEPNHFIIRDVFDNATKIFSVFYRVLPATTTEGQVIRDEFGRQIVWVEGGVLVEKLNFRDVTIENSDIDNLHVYLEKEFFDFWQQESEGYLPQPSPANKFIIRKIEDEQDVEFVYENPYKIISKVPPKSPPIVYSKKNFTDSLADILEQIADSLRRW
jgi:hypothetical protein